MRNKIYQLFEYAYILVAVFFTYQAITNWTDNRGQAYMFIFFVIVAIFMFFFKRKFRKMIEERNKNQDNK